MATQSEQAQGSDRGGLVWGDPLSTDLVNLCNVHTRLRYFSEIGGRDTQEAVAVNFSVQF